MSHWEEGSEQEEQVEYYDDAFVAKLQQVTVQLSNSLFVNMPSGFNVAAGQRVAKTSKMIAVFMLDGSDRYTNMTINAINAFLKSTPEMHAGVLIPPSWGVSVFVARIVPYLIAPERVVFRNWSQHFTRWNPTQYKLDMVKFADEYDIITWLDSDTLAYDDLRPLLHVFDKSPAKYMFVRDHVCFKEEFLKNWPFYDGKTLPFVPQACFMAFKSQTIKSFFEIWENTWRQWIEPEPFHNFADPLPSFHASKFCIEQYALGHALHLAKVGPQDILEIVRANIVLNTRNPSGATGGGSTAGAGGAFGGANAGRAGGAQGASGTGIAGAFSDSTSQFWDSSALLSREALAQRLASSYPYMSYPYSSFIGSYSLSSYLSSYSSYSSYAMSSYSSYFLGGITYFDGTNTNLRVFNWSGPGSQYQYGAGQQGGEGGQHHGGDHGGHHGQHHGGQQQQQQHYQGPPLPEVLVVDNLGGCVVHLYNNFYEQIHQWWLENEAAIVQTLKSEEKAGQQ